MDNMGYVCSAFDRGRCMMVPSSLVGEGSPVAITEEAPVEIGPCAGRKGGGNLYISRFIYGDGGRLRLRGHEDRCVTFLGGDAPTTGSLVMLYIFRLHKY
jgi:hypothetical protein